jgi:hypothetical protein
VRKKIKVSKLDAARRQLDGAIRVWLQDGDSVVIHTLVCAAYQIVVDINGKKGNKEIQIQEILRHGNLKPEIIEEATQYIRNPMRFFKHADLDPHDTLNFSPSLSELFIHLAIKGFELLGEVKSDIQASFRFWISLHDPELYKGNEFCDTFYEKVPEDVIEQLKEIEKGDFLEATLPVIAKVKALGKIS